MGSPKPEILQGYKCPTGACPLHDLYKIVHAIPLLALLDVVLSSRGVVMKLHIPCFETVGWTTVKSPSLTILLGDLLVD